MSDDFYIPSFSLEPHVNSRPRITYSITYPVVVGKKSIPLLSTPVRDFEIRNNRLVEPVGIGWSQFRNETASSAQDTKKRIAYVVVLFDEKGEKPLVLPCNVAITFPWEVVDLRT